MATASTNASITAEERKVIFASSLGTIFEWYDFYLYATLAPFFGSVFFPSGNDTAALVLGLVCAALGWWWPRQDRVPRLLSVSAYFVSGTIAGLLAWTNALRGHQAPVWDPTPRAHSGTQAN